MNGIFVVGRNRSGTKWLSNILSNHKRVASVQRREAGGIVETNLFLQYSKLLNLNNIEDRTAFEILFKNSNFYKSANISELSDFNFKTPNTFFSFFENFMQQFASEKEADFWLQKASSLSLNELYKEFPNAKFIIIQRDNVVENVISSILLKYAKVTMLGIFKNITLYWLHRKVENKFINKKNVLVINYENLKSNKPLIINQVCKFLNLNFTEDLLVDSYKPNSSFKDKNRNDFYTTQNKLLITTISFFVSMIPLKILFFVKNLYKNKQGKFVSQTFSMYRKQNLT